MLTETVSLKKYIEKLEKKWDRQKCKRTINPQSYNEVEISERP